MEELETNFGKLIENWSGKNQWLSSLSEELLECTEVFGKRLKDKDKDLTICISAVQEGSGKSTLAIILGFLLDMENFDLKKNIAYVPDYETIEAQFMNIIRYNMFIIDEGITTLHKHDWASSGLKNLSRMLVTKRFENKAVAILMPRLQDLPEAIRNHKVLMNAKIMKRGTAILHIRDDSDTNDPWWLEWANKWQQKNWKSKHVADITFGERVKLEENKRTFFMELDFPKLPAPVEKVYLKLKEEAHKERYGQDESKESKDLKAWKYKVFKAVRMIRFFKPKLSKNKICEELEMSKDTLKKILIEYDPLDSVFGFKTPEQLVAEQKLPGFIIEDETQEPLVEDLVEPSRAILEP